MLLRYRRQVLTIAGVFVIALLYTWAKRDVRKHEPTIKVVPSQTWQDPSHDTYLWKTLTVHYPVSSFQPLPTTPPRAFPKVQSEFPSESEESRQTRLEHQKVVKETLLRCWGSYKKHAWMADELQPLTGEKRNPFGGWAATLVDTLDTLWIMDLHDEFDEAVGAAETIDFTHTDSNEVNIFETTIRYLGGFLSAYELSEDVRLLRKAVQVGEMVYKAFDTPNHLPATRWNIGAAIRGEKQTGVSGVLSAELGTFSLEFTRLSQLTGDPKWFDASQRIMDIFAAQQNATELPGLWPLTANTNDGIFSEGSTFTLGAMADSLYEYLPKMSTMMGGQLPIYQHMYEKAVDTASQHNLFRPMTPTKEDILISAQVLTRTGSGKREIQVDHQGQHLVCFLGGNLALGGKLFDRSQDIVLGTKLMDGCIYAYKAFPHGVMPETFKMASCPLDTECNWDERLWKQAVLTAHGRPIETSPSIADSIISQERLPKGFTDVPDRRYILRPEAIESVFMLYRITARQDLLKSAWDMFRAIEDITKTRLANSAVDDVTIGDQKPKKSGSMESFWMGETLKYFYLIFSDPELLSLDDYVFNTEAHPLKRLK